MISFVDDEMNSECLSLLIAFSVDCIFVAKVCLSACLCLCIFAEKTVVYAEMTSSLARNPTLFAVNMTKAALMVAWCFSFGYFCNPKQSEMVHSVFSTMPMFVCGFWSVLFLLQFDRKNTPKVVFTVFMLVATVLYCCHSLYFNRCFSVLPFSNTLYNLASLSVYPLFYVYIRTLTDVKPLTWKDFALLLPTLLVSLAVGVVYLLMSEQEKMDFIMANLYHLTETPFTSLMQVQKVLHIASTILFSVQVLAVLGLGFRRLAMHKRRIETYFSSTQKLDLSQVKWLLVLFAFTSLLSFVVNLIGRYRFFNADFMLAIPSTLFSVALYALAYVGFSQEPSASSLMEIDTIAAEKHNDSYYSVELKDMIIKKIEESQLYLQPNLKISDLAAHLGTNRNYLYNAINVGMGVSFSEFVNRYRIVHAQRLLMKNPEANMGEIAMQSGFSSEVTFYRNFKAVTGTTPCKWLKSQK